MYISVCVCVLVKFSGKFLLACIQLAVKALTSDKQQTTVGEAGSISWSNGVSVCDSVARLFADWPQMHLV